MKHLLLTTIAAVVLVGCGPSADIHEAARTGNIEAIKQHIAAGADVNAKSYEEWTLLARAAFGGHKEIVELLIANGADVNAEREGGYTPLIYAAGSGGHKEIVELLIANGAVVNAFSSSTNFMSTSSLTPLHTAAYWGRKEITELFIANGADVNAKSETYGTPLDVAIKYKRTEIADLLRKRGGKTGEELKAEGK
jgi:ankyrin repeat protein